MDIHTYVVVDLDDQYVSEEHPGKAEAVNDAQSRDEPHAVVELTYTFSDSELVWWPDDALGIWPCAFVTVRAETTYECGHEVIRDVRLVAPEPGADLFEWFQEHDVGGDGHGAPGAGCAGERSERALYEMTIIDAPPDRPELVGETFETEG
jgi:hypothetical protein